MNGDRPLSGDLVRLSAALFAAKGEASAAGFADQRMEDPQAAGTAPPAPLADPATILIVEDNAMIMKVLRDLLRFRGYQVMEATDGAEALSRARERRPDLVLMDIRLPERSGLDVARHLRADGVLENATVIAMTAFARQWDEATVRAAGFDGLLAKPFPLASLHETVAGFMARSASP